MWLSNWVYRNVLEIVLQLAPPASYFGWKSHSIIVKTFFLRIQCSVWYCDLWCTEEAAGPVQLLTVLGKHSGAVKTGTWTRNSRVLASK